MDICSYESRGMIDFSESVLLRTGNRNPFQFTLGSALIKLLSIIMQHYATLYTPILALGIA
jgi:hypothetical protein